MTGLLLVDKPAGITSHDVVDHIRKAAKMRRVGHTGTLDPAATGLMIVCLGPATRLSEHLTGLDKSYEGVMRLGMETASYDADGEVVAESAVPDTNIEELQLLCDRFVGNIEQVPPMVSAVKVGGERLYKLARKGEVVDRPARAVTIHCFDVLSYEAPDARILVSCTSGTYVRTLCHDVGQLLGCGAILAQLRRTKVGTHDVADAQPMEAFQTPEDVEQQLLPMGEALDLPEVVVRRSGMSALHHGNPLTNLDLKEVCTVRDGWVQIKNDAGRLLALGFAQGNAMGVEIQPKRVFIK